MAVAVVHAVIVIAALMLCAQNSCHQITGVTVQLDKHRYITCPWY